MLPSRTCWSTEVAVWELGILSLSELSDGCTVHPQSVPFAKTFFLQEITQPANRNEQLLVNTVDFGTGRTC